MAIRRPFPTSMIVGIFTAILPLLEFIQVIFARRVILIAARTECSR